MRSGASVECKQKHVTNDDKNIGDQYTFVSFDRKSKLVLNYVIGKRTAGNAQKLMDDLTTRITNRPQISTDGFTPYIDAVEWAFGANVDYAQLSRFTPATKLVGSVTALRNVWERSQAS